MIRLIAVSFIAAVFTACVPANSPQRTMLASQDAETVCHEEEVTGSHFSRTICTTATREKADHDQQIRDLRKGVLTEHGTALK